MGSVSLLLGAGFSMPKGYPSASKINEQIGAFKAEEWQIGSAYEFFRREPDSHLWISGHRVLLDILQELILLYKTDHDFDYEQFYDLLSKPVESELKSNFEDWFISFSKRRDIRGLDQLVNNSKSVYSNLILYYIKDEKGEQYYPSVHYGKPLFDGYTNFLYLIEELGRKYDEVHIHTLNHDLVFEIFNDSDWMFNELCDGFEELGSHYYGETAGYKDIPHTVRRPFYTDEFKKKYKLYKLHGSINYIPFHGENGIVKAFIKKYPGISFEHFYEEINDVKGLRYHNDWVNLHPD
ncbi:MAG: hypothetical protein HYZ42_15700, partial [Bacteroidetes bacterium]|nr:hypothetical protein [Bacteroidota bacterium]